jgi:hypothetical protein
MKEIGEYASKENASGRQKAGNRKKPQDAHETSLRLPQFN